METYDRVLKEYAPLISAMVYNLSKGCGSQDDLIQVGRIGLWQAWEAHNAGLGASFKTFAVIRIRGAILDEMRNDDILTRKERKSIRSNDDIPGWLEAMNHHRNSAEDGDLVESADMAELSVVLTDILKHVELMGYRYQVIFYESVYGVSDVGIAAMLGVAPSRVGQLHQDIIRHLKRAMEGLTSKPLVDGPCRVGMQDQEQLSQLAAESRARLYG